ncbi:MAG: hypothetical protein DMF89_14740 [Acidobacteria bacterium]|nr:MAG: hypothetical protein DMF89_14740 [Acidobacteriota bacterium]
MFVSYTYDAYVGIAHPSRVYNIRALGIPYLYIGPRESPVQELGPPFSVRHGDVDGVVRAIETSAQSDARWRAVACEVSDHARDWLIARMVTVFETAASSPQRAQPRPVSLQPPTSTNRPPR